MGISRAIIPAFSEDSRNRRTCASPRAFSLRLRTASGSSLVTNRRAADRSSPNVLDGAAPASSSSAAAAPAADKMLVSSSMIRTWTGWIFPAASAAKVRGSRAATLQA